MRCPDCRKFVSYEDADPEVNDENMDESAREDGKVTVSASVRMVKQCAECGTELAEYTFEMEEEVDISGHEWSVSTGDDGSETEHELSVNFGDAENTERYQKTARNRKTGKETVIKSMRYQKHFYGVDLQYTVQCSCGEGWEGCMSDETSASGLEELV